MSFHLSVTILMAVFRKMTCASGKLLLVSEQTSLVSTIQQQLLSISPNKKLSFSTGIIHFSAYIFTVSKFFWAKELVKVSQIDMPDYQ